MHFPCGVIAAFGGPSGWIARGRLPRHRSSTGSFRPASSLFLASGPFQSNADATGESEYALAGYVLSLGVGDGAVAAFGFGAV
jgi:hypothetical protein